MRRCPEERGEQEDEREARDGAEADRPDATRRRPHRRSWRPPRSPSREVELLFALLVRSISRQDAPAFVCDLLQRGAVLGREDLSARSVAKALGQTTGFLYHHWGSFDAFLFEVSGLGWQRLVDALVRAYAKLEAPRDVLHAYVEFAAEHPVLYWLLAERTLAPDVTRAMLEGGAALPSFKAWQAILALMSRAEPGITLAGDE